MVLPGCGRAAHMVRPVDLLTSRAEATSPRSDQGSTFTVRLPLLRR